MKFIFLGVHYSPNIDIQGVQESSFDNGSYESSLELAPEKCENKVDMCSTPFSMMTL
jgi:hypothetical protein